MPAGARSRLEESQSPTTSRLPPSSFLLFFFRPRKVFSDEAKLGRHLKQHELRFPCPVAGCGKAFAFAQRLAAHARVHKPDRPLCCPVPGCGQTFKVIRGPFSSFLLLAFDTE